MGVTAWEGEVSFQETYYQDGQAKLRDACCGLKAVTVSGGSAVWSELSSGEIVFGWVDSACCRKVGWWTLMSALLW